MAAGASPTGGVGGIFYFLLLLIGLIRRSYYGARKSIVSNKYVAFLILLVAIMSVATINIVFVYRLVNFQLFSGENGNGLGSIGVELNWQFQPTVIFTITLLEMFVVAFILMRESEKSILYRAGCVILTLIYVILVAWLPVGILVSLY
jgi:hypothetical protein